MYTNSFQKIDKRREYAANVQTIMSGSETASTPPTRAHTKTGWPSLVSFPNPLALETHLQGQVCWGNWLHPGWLGHPGGEWKCRNACLLRRAHRNGVSKSTLNEMQYFKFAKLTLSVTHYVWKSFSKRIVQKERVGIVDYLSSNQFRKFRHHMVLNLCCIKELYVFCIHFLKASKEPMHTF